MFEIFIYRVQIDQVFLLDYDGLRIGGLVITGLLVAGGIGIICCKSLNFNINALHLC